MTAFGSQGKFEEADALLLRAIGIREDALGPDHPNVAVLLSNRAGVLQAQVIDLPFQQLRYSVSRNARPRGVVCLIASSVWCLGYE